MSNILVNDLSVGFSKLGLSDKTVTLSANVAAASSSFLEMKHSPGARDALEQDAPMLQMLANMGVEYSSQQERHHAAVNGSDFSALDALFQDSGFLNGSKNVSDEDIALFCALYNPLALASTNSMRQESATGRWFNRVARVLHEKQLLSGNISGLDRIGSQIDLRPNCVIGAGRAVDATRRNKGVKKGASQRDREKASKETKGDAKKQKKAAKEPKESGETSANGKTSAAVDTPLQLTQDEARDRLWSRLAKMGVIPYREVDPVLDVVKPVGHDTHNLFVKDKKSKKMFLITAKQSSKIDLKTLTKTLGMKQLRMMRLDDKKNYTFIRKGCITSLSLYNDVTADITPVFDSKLFELNSLRICAGCEDPADHSQHNVVDVTMEQILTLLAESGHAAPIQVDLQEE
eukprot:g2791.t1